MPKIDRLNQDTGFEVITVTLSPGERMSVEFASLVCADNEIKIEKGYGPIRRELLLIKKMVPSLKLTNISKSIDQNVTICSNKLGDIQIIDLSEILDKKIIVKRGSYFAHIDRNEPIKIGPYSTSLNLKLSKIKIFESIEGDGIVFIASDGFCMKRTLEEGEQFIVDRSNILMYDENMKPSIAYKPSTLQVFVSFDGPGTILINTHNTRRHTCSHSSMDNSDNFAMIQSRIL